MKRAGDAGGILRASLLAQGLEIREEFSLIRSCSAPFLSAIEREERSWGLIAEA